ncbi:hypothetical protein CRE_15818, partial [Caenorhabditis remanei]
MTNEYFKPVNDNQTNKTGDNSRNTMSNSQCEMTWNPVARTYAQAASTNPADDKTVTVLGCKYNLLKLGNTPQTSKRSPPKPSRGGARISSVYTLTDELEITHREEGKITFAIDLPNKNNILCPLCRECTQTRGRGSSFTKHMKLHVKEKHQLDATFIYKCSMCNEYEPEKKCGTKWIQTHLQKVHNYKYDESAIVVPVPHNTRQQIANELNNAAPFVDIRKTKAAAVEEKKTENGALLKFLTTSKKDNQVKSPSEDIPDTESPEKETQALTIDPKGNNSPSKSSIKSSQSSASSICQEIQEIITLSEDEDPKGARPKPGINVWSLINETGKDAYIDTDIMMAFLKMRVENCDSVNIIDPLNYQFPARVDLVPLIQRNLEDGKNRVVFPICADEHWTLLTISNGIAAFYDPTGSRMSSYIEELVNELGLIIPKEQDEQPRQRDSYNCGVFVMKMAEAFIQDTEWEMEEVEKDVKNFRRNLLEELKPNYEIFAEKIKYYNSPGKSFAQSRPTSRSSQCAVCPTCSRSATPMMDVGNMEVDPVPQQQETPKSREPEQDKGWKVVGNARKKGVVTERSPNISPEAKRQFTGPEIKVVSPGKFHPLAGETEEMEVTCDSPPTKEPTVTPSLPAMKIASPEVTKKQTSKKKGKYGKKKQQTKKAQPPKGEPTKKAQPKGEPAKLIEQVRTWFDKQMKSYQEQGSNIQTLTWIADSLTAAIFKANNGNKYLVDKITARCPPPLLNEGEMATQTSRRTEAVKPKDRFAKESNEPLRIQYAKNRAKTFNVIIGKHSARCEIDINVVENHFRQTLKAQPVTAEALNTVCSGIKKAEVDPSIEGPISSGEVKAILAKIKDTSPGTDGVKYSDLKWFDPEGERLALLFDECRQHGKIPSHWKEAETVLLPKDCTEEERKKPENWRPISLMATVYKLYSSVWNRRISSVKGVISECQRGFQAIDGCNESIGILRMCIDTATVLNRNLSCSWLDLTNAFGSVPHELIRRSLAAFGYPESVINIISDMYNGSSMRVKTAEQKTQNIMIEAGVKQGDPISPTLFNICLEGIIRRHQTRKTGYNCVGNKVRCLAFADDLAILTNSQDEMQDVINQLDKDCRSVALIFKPKKCASLTIKKGSVDQYARIKIQGTPIRTMSDGDTYKYLGVQTGNGGRASESESLTQIAAELQMVHDTDLAPNQKLDVLKAFILPRLQHMYRNATPKLTELKEFENTVMKSVKMYHNIPIKGSPLEYVQIPVKNGGLGVMSPRFTCLITFLASTLFKLWSDDEYISSIHKKALSRITAKVMGLKTQKATLQEQCEYLNTKKAITKGGYSLFSRMNEAIRTLSANLGAPLKSMRFIPENDEIALEVQASENSQIKVFSKTDSMKLVTKLKDLVKSAMLKNFLENKKVKSKVVQVLQHHPQSNKF